LAKAEDRAAKRNLELGGGMSSSNSYNSLLSIDKCRAVKCIQELEINFGLSKQDKLENLEQLVVSDIERCGLDQEGEREQSWIDSDSEEESLEFLELDALKSLCGDMMEEVFDESRFPLNCELKGHMRKGKFHAKSCLRKTCKLRRANISKKDSK